MGGYAGGGIFTADYAEFAERLCDRETKQQTDSCCVRLGFLRGFSLR
jgi:hypothetical protein